MRVKQFFCLMTLALMFITTPLYAQETWVAFVWGRGECKGDDGIPVQIVCATKYAIAWGGRNKDETLRAALKECETRPNPMRNCGDTFETDAWPTKCVSVTKGTHMWGRHLKTNYYAEGADERLAAERGALAACPSYGQNCRIVETRCSN